jgi:hypothetical protein
MIMVRATVTHQPDAIHVAILSNRPSERQGYKQKPPGSLPAAPRADQPDTVS